MWTTFWDMHSGGSAKLPWTNIYIEADEDRACELFEQFFDRDPRQTTCDCCGPDYALDNHTTLSAATAYHRNCGWDRATGEYVERADGDAPHLTTLEYVHKKDVLVIHADELEGFDAALARQRALTIHATIEP